MQAARVRTLGMGTLYLTSVKVMTSGRNGSALLAVLADEDLPPSSTSALCPFVTPLAAGGGSRGRSCWHVQPQLPCNFCWAGGGRQHSPKAPPYSVQPMPTAAMALVLVHTAGKASGKACTAGRRPGCPVFAAQKGCRPAMQLEPAKPT
jgi:hypothetical protein